jgi:hypothetical protein
LKFVSLFDAFVEIVSLAGVMSDVTKVGDIDLSNPAAFAALGDSAHVRMYATEGEKMVAPPPASIIEKAAPGHGIKLIPLATATLSLGVPQVIANGPRGTRLIVEVAGAEWVGERLKAKQLGAPAGDWALVSHEGTLSIDVRATLDTDDGAMIYVSYQGRSDYTKAGAAPIVTVPLFETSDPRYLWLNKVQAIARGRSEGMSKLIYDIYEVQ